MECDVLDNERLKIQLIHTDSAQPCTSCVELKTDKEQKEVESAPTHTILPPTPILQLPLSPSLSSGDDEKSMASSTATSFSCKENVAPEMEEEEEEMEGDEMEDDMEADEFDHRSASAAQSAAAAAALVNMNICQLGQERMEIDTQRFLRAAPNQGIQPLPMGLMP